MLKDMAFETVTGEKIVSEAKKQAISVAGQVAQRIPSLTEATAMWLDQYQKGRFTVTVDTSELSKEVGRLTRLGRQIVIAVMLVGLVIGSAVATGVAAYSDETGRVWETLSRVAPVALILALVVSFLIVFRLTWRWMRGKTTDED